MLLKHTTIKAKRLKATLVGDYVTAEDDELTNPNFMTLRANTDEQKTHVMKLILTAWKKCPELRLGQLINNATARQAGEKSLYYIEDSALLQLIRAEAELD